MSTSLNFIAIIDAHLQLDVTESVHSITHWAYASYFHFIR